MERAEQQQGGGREQASMPCRVQSSVGVLFRTWGTVRKRLWRTSGNTPSGGQAIGPAVGCCLLLLVQQIISRDDAWICCCEADAYVLSGEDAVQPEPHLIREIRILCVHVARSRRSNTRLRLLHGGSTPAQNSNIRLTLMGCLPCLLPRCPAALS